MKEAAKADLRWRPHNYLESTMRRSVPALMLGALLLSTVSASATLIDFEDQPAGPTAFGLIAAQTLTYTFGSLTATFNGGAILGTMPSDTLVPLGHFLHGPRLGPVKEG
jgi:hypothetical protein